ncbi:MAG: hypothetical protein PUI99_07760 [Clostridiales bacterium]|nr:hypothetical protein [Clostridiales bacterium]
MYDSYGYGQPMMQQMQMRQNDWQQRMQSRNAPRYEVIQVNGENGARAFAMAPNSSALLMDSTAPIVWLCTTDGAGYLTASPFSIAPYQQEKPVDVKTLEERIERLEAKLSEQSDAAPAKRRAARTTTDADAE